MANLVYKRVSTDQQSTARQNLVLADAGIEDPVVFEEEAEAGAATAEGGGRAPSVPARRPTRGEHQVNVPAHRIGVPR
ncbi:hypothetical protein ABT112_32610 [Streptomyces sp. NPDC002055]|uniref:hypothetical protein n=1 Tax=Streptomyces sp. NPDC002055 TaxID=3154534 RepID=UPI0033246D7D